MPACQPNGHSPISCRCNSFTRRALSLLLPPTRELPVVNALIYFSICINAASFLKSKKPCQALTAWFFWKLKQRSRLSHFAPHLWAEIYNHIWSNEQLVLYTKLQLIIDSATQIDSIFTITMTNEMNIVVYKRIKTLYVGTARARKNLPSPVRACSISLVAITKLWKSSSQIPRRYPRNSNWKHLLCSSPPVIHIFHEQRKRRSCEHQRVAIQLFQRNDNAQAMDFVHYAVHILHCCFQPTTSVLVPGWSAYGWNRRTLKRGHKLNPGKRIWYINLWRTTRVDCTQRIICVSDDSISMWSTDRFWMYTTNSTQVGCDDQQIEPFFFFFPPPPPQMGGLVERLTKH